MQNSRCFHSKGRSGNTCTYAFGCALPVFIARVYKPIKAQRNENLHYPQAQLPTRLGGAPCAYRPGDPQPPPQHPDHPLPPAPRRVRRPERACRGYEPRQSPPHPDSRCEEYIRQLRAIADRLHETGKPYTVSDITGTYKLGGDNRYVDIFAEHVARELENAGRFGTARSYRSLRSAWVKFADRRQWRFSQLDGGTVSAFAAYLESRGRKRNTVTFYLRTLHALYNRARVYGCAPIHRDPFPNVSFKPARTPKLAVNRSLLRILATSDFGDCELNEARDMFLFSFYARGMSFVDICYLRKENIRGGTLHYERQKTHQPFSVALTPQLQEIISRYDDPASPWALPCMGRGMIRSAFRNEEMAGDMPPGKLYTFYRMALQYYITQLKKVSRSVGCRRLTFNVARHTWATEARGMGVPMPHISEGLGHTSERTTRCYLAQLDSGTVDRINEKVTKLY